MSVEKEPGEVDKNRRSLCTRAVPTYLFPVAKSM